MKQRLHVLAEHLARELVAEVGAGPPVVVVVDEVGLLEEVGHPADAALGERELHGRGTCAGSATTAAPTAKIAVWNGIEWGITSNGVRGMKLGIAAEVEHHDGAGVLARLPGRVPLVAVVVGHAEAVRLGVERHRVAAQVGQAADLLGHQVGAEDEAGEPERDEAARVRAAPLVDVPVVVGADHRGHELVVVVLRRRTGRRGRATTGS